MSSLLHDVYYDIFSSAFKYEDFSDRIRMQKAIYLLENMGVNIGQYNFVWYKHGPYSQRLQDEAYFSCPSKQTTVFSDFAHAKIQQLKSYIKQGENTGYSVQDWLEAIASLHFMIDRKYIDGKDALQKIKVVKPHLNNDVANKQALIIAQEIKNAVQ
jgi:hypothetical protein